jgi:GAF domain-containing protein/HAMP domain-containing protein
MFFTRSLRARTLLYVLIPTALGLLAVATIGLYAYERVARDLVQQRDAELANLQAARLSEGLTDYTDLLQDFAAQRDVRSMDIDLLAVATSKAPPQFKDFDAGVVIFDEEGEAVWSTSPIPSRRGTPYPLPSQFELMRLIHESDLSDVFTDPLTGQDIVSLAVPVPDQAGQFLGVVAGLQTVGGSPFTQVYTHLLQVSPEQSGQAYIVDGNGRVIYHSQASRTGHDLSNWSPVSRATAGENGALLIDDQTGDRVVSGFAPVPDTRWALVTQQSWNDVVGPIRGYSRLLLGVLMIAALSSGTLVYLSIGRALRPIRDLTDGAERIAGGDFEYTISAQTGDEVEALGEQFNLMARALKESYHDLERRVSERTKELAALIAVAEVVGSTLDLDELIGAALEKTLEVMEVEAGGIYLLQDDAVPPRKGKLNIASHRGLSEGFAREIDNLGIGEGFSGRVVESGEPMIVRDLHRDPRLTRSVVAQSGFRTVAIVPLATRDKTWGSLFVITRSDREFASQDIEFLSHIADQIAVAIENARLFVTEQRRAEQFRVISDVTRHMISVLNVDDLLDEIVRSIKETRGYYLVGISLVAGDELVIEAGAGPPFEDPSFQPLQVTVGGKGVTGWVAATGEPLLVRDVSQDERYFALSAKSQTRSELCVPLKTKEGVIGVLNVESDRVDAFDEGDLAVLQSLANQAAIAIENARLYEDVKSRLAQVTALQETIKAVASTLELDKLLNLITEEATALLQADGGVLNLVDWDANEDEVVAGTGSVDFAQGFRSPLEGSLSGWASLHNQAFATSELREDSRVDLRALSWVEEDRPGRPIRSAAVAPLTIKGEVVGTLLVVDKQDGAADFDQTDLDLLVALANQAAVAIENAGLFDAVQRRAEQFRVLSEIGARITSLLDVDELLQETVRLVNEVLGYYLVAIGLTEGDELVVKFGAGPRWRDAEFQPPRIPVGQGISGWVAQKSEPLLVPDVSQDHRYLMLEDSAETRSELAVPLRAKSKVIGVLDVQSDQLNAFDESDLLVLQSLANLTAIALEEARLFDAEQRRAEQFRVISEVGASITSILTVDELLKEIVWLVKTSLGYYHTAIGLVENDRLFIKAGVGAHWEDPDFEPSSLQVGGKGITAWVAASGQPLLVPDVSEDPRYLTLSGSKEIKSEVAVPLKTASGVIGVLDVQSDEFNGLDESDLALLESVAHQAAIAIENARLYEQAQQAAALQERSRLARELHDAVTQTLFSASLIGEVLPSLWESDQEEGRNLLLELRQLTRGALAEMRTLLLELRPAALAESNLQDLLAQLGEAVTGRSGLPVSVQVEGEPDLPADVHVALYRIAQEALNNVVKHAKATEVSVLLSCGALLEHDEDGHSSSAELEVRDNGCGFDLDHIPADRLGLGIIQERTEAIGAALDIKTDLGSGTMVRVVWKSDHQS